MNRNFNTLLLFLSITCSSYAQDLNSGLVAKYEFNGSANDNIGTNHGTVQGATSTNDRFNNSNSAYSFDGINDYIEIADNDLLDFGYNEDFSIAVWVNISSNQKDLGGTNNDIISKWNSLRSMPYPYAIRYWNISASEERKNKIFNLRYDTETCNHNPYMTGNCLISADKWHQLIFVKRGNSLEYYQDGVLFGTADDNTVASCNTINNNRVLIGRRTLGGRFFTGIIDDISFYNRALETNEIELLFTYNDWSAPEIEGLSIDMFNIPSQTSSTIINYENKTVNITVPCNTDLNNLTPTFSLSDNTEVFVDNVSQTSGVTSNSFSNSLIYSLQSLDKCYVIDWTVSVHLESFNQEYINSSIQILSFNIQNQIGVTEIDKDNTKIKITMPCDSDLNNRIANFSLPQGSNAYINETVQISGKSKNDFSASLVYNIVSDNTCTNQEWTIEVILEYFEEEYINDMTLFKTYQVKDQIGSTEINTNLHEVRVKMPCNSNLSELVNTFTLPDNTIAIVNESEQKSGVSINNFRTPVTYSIRSTNRCFSMDWKVYILYAKLEIESLELSNPNSVIPNIITPNGDDYNESFVLGNLFLNSEVMIYNRHGIKVYESANYQNEFNGASLASGQYYYTIKTNCFENLVKGTLNILY